MLWKQSGSLGSQCQEQRYHSNYELTGWYNVANCAVNMNIRPHPTLFKLFYTKSPNHFSLQSGEVTNTNVQSYFLIYKKQNKRQENSKRWLPELRL